MDLEKLKPKEEKKVESVSKLGLLWMLMGSLTMGFMNVSVKFIKREQHVSVIEVAYFRGVIMAVGSYFHASLTNTSIIDITRVKSMNVFYRCIFGFLSFFG